MRGAVWVVLVGMIVAIQVAAEASPPHQLPKQGTEVLPAFTHEAYIWQRQWSPKIAKSVRMTSDLFAGWRVLVAQVDGAGRVRPVRVDWPLLASTNKPVTAVVRVEAAITPQNRASIIGRLKQLSNQWAKAGVRLQGLEIDNDCPVARLSDFAQFLVDLKEQRGLPPRLSVTAIPAWLPAHELDRVLAATDFIVLQVHGARGPQRLFNADMAARWINTLARRDTKPFRVALPDYGTRIIQGANGAILAAESETPLLAGGGVEMMATPAEVQALLRTINRQRPRGLAGFVWFRLPAEGDQRIWSVSTLRAVITGQPADARLEVQARPARMRGLFDITLANDSDMDVEAPARIALPESCTAADGINGYGLGVSGVTLQRLQKFLVHAHHERVVGWARCSKQPGAINVFR